MELHFQSLYTLPSDCQHNRTPQGPATENSFAAFRPVSVQEVQQLLSRLPTCKAPGPDGLCPTELKIAANFIAPSLAVLFNESLVSGELPAGFKEGNISPIFKTGKTDPSGPENYRESLKGCIYTYPELLENVFLVENIRMLLGRLHVYTTNDSGRLHVSRNIRMFRCSSSCC